MRQELGVIGTALVLLLGGVVFVGRQAQENAKAIRQLQAPDEQKICSYFVPGNWRDSILVSAAWTKEQCQALGAQTGAAYVQLACAFRGNVMFGPESETRLVPAPPSPRNCGW